MSVSQPSQQQHPQLQYEHPADKKQILHKNLSAILSESRFSAVNQNIAEKFLVPFALVLHASSLSVGLLSTLPQLLGACTQIYSVKVLHKFPSRQRLIMSLMLLQSFLWFPLFLVPLLFPSIGIFAVIVSYSVFYMIGGFFTPAWSNWIVAIVPEHARGKIYGRKNQTAGRFGFLAATLGGYLLSVLGNFNLWIAYGVLFSAAFIQCAFFYASHLYGRQPPLSFFFLQSAGLRRGREKIQSQPGYF